MKTNDEIRAVAWNALWKGRWVWKLLALWLILYAFSSALGYVLSFVQWAFGADDWGGYFTQRILGDILQPFSAALDPALGRAFARTLKLGELPDVTRPIVAARYTLMSLVGLLVSATMGGLSAVAFAHAWLRAAGKTGAGGLGAALGAIRRPAGLLGLYLLQNAIVLFLSLFLWVPGYYASFCFQASYFLKADHPDWGPVRCLVESNRLMRGYKRRAFGLDWSYWAVVTWAMVPLLGVSLLVFPLFAGDILIKIISALLILSLLVVSMVIGWFANEYVGIGQAVLYREILANEGDFSPLTLDKKGPF